MKQSLVTVVRKSCHHQSPVDWFPTNHRLSHVTVWLRATITSHPLEGVGPILLTESVIICCPHLFDTDRPSRQLGNNNLVLRTVFPFADSFISPHFSSSCWSIRVSERKVLRRPDFRARAFLFVFLIQTVVRLLFLFAHPTVRRWLIMGNRLFSFCPFFGAHFKIAVDWRRVVGTP